MRRRRVQIVMLVPLTLLSALWTVELLDHEAPAEAEKSLAAATVVPTEAIEDPASYTVAGPGQGAPGKREAHRIVQSASTNGIPSAALAAYQRAATVMRSAEQACQIT